MTQRTTADPAPLSEAGPPGPGLLRPAVGIVVDWLSLPRTLGGWQMAGVVLMLGAIGAGERSARRHR